MKKRIIMSVSGVALLGLLGWQIYQSAFTSKNSGSSRNRGPAAVAVEIAPVETRTLQDMGEFTGTLFAKSKVVIAPKIAGRLEKLWFDIGDKIKANQLIAQLDDAEYIQQQHQAQATLEVSNANLETTRNALELAQRELERIRELRTKKVVSASELELAEAQYSKQQADYRVGQAQVTEKQAALEATKIRLSYTRIHALWEEPQTERVIGERFVDEGALLTANSPIVSILDISSVIAVINVTERDYFKLQLKQPVSVVNNVAEEKIFQGKVIRIAPLIQETSRQARVEIEVPNPKNWLKPGMFVHVRIQFDEHANTTVVPTKAIVERNEVKGVFEADLNAKKAKFMPVRLGIVQGLFTEVLAPKLSGQVVTLGHHLLQDGSDIILPAQDSALESSSEQVSRKKREQKEGK
ncbi:efflux RND transporter periplasmic adaptor subunit [Deltaproteobacteria bacterium TL4]